LKFVLEEKKRVEKKEITGGSLRNSVKTIKTLCEVTDVLIPWKKITRGLPRVKRYADHRAPTIEEITKIIEYPDRRIKPIVYTMGPFIEPLVLLEPPHSNYIIKLAVH
jgi:hypothetical protein